jgi:hypothetical protein
LAFTVILQIFSVVLKLMGGRGVCPVAGITTPLEAQGPSSLLDLRGSPFSFAVVIGLIRGSSGTVRTEHPYLFGF